MQDLPKSYTPKDVESKWSAFWDEHHLAQKQSDSTKQPFCVVMPPPNVTGVLHMGHALVDTLQDIIIRFKRMQGYNAFWIPGTDHAGIATQTVVEKQLLKSTGKKRKEFSREEFLSHVWKAKEKNESVIVNQIKKLGCSVDWSHYRFTMDEKSNRAVNLAFKKLFDDKLIYRGDYLVNWDPITQTALSDDEVEHEEIDSYLWFIRYPVEDSYIIVATTRPETLFGDVAIAVHPEDARFASMIGKKASLPLTDRTIPILADEMVDSDFGSGAVKITPAHDPNDYELSSRFNLPLINILEKDGTLNELCGDFANLSVDEARKKVVATLQEQKLIEKIEPYKMRIGISYRSKAVIQPFLSKQWFIHMEPFKEELIKAVRDKKVELVPTHWEDTYMHWIENLRDWCISRQLWWGHQIPIWYNKQDPSKMICYEKEGLPPEVEKDPSQWLQDEDVLDTWFSSALWPFSTLGWPEKTEELKIFYPNQLLITGHDILFFWVARMIMMGNYFMKDIPFHKCFIHGLIYGKSYFRIHEDHVHYVSAKEKKRYDLGDTLPEDVTAKWEKMSKTKGNVLDPLEIIEDYGTDALRMALSSSVTFARQIDLDLRRFEEFKNFANKIYNGARFVLMNITNLTAGSWEQGLDERHFTLEDRWILSELNQVISDTTGYLDNYAFDKASHLLYDFYWNRFCAFYLEIAKPVLYAKESPYYAHKQKLLTIILTAMIRLMHPIAPFVTEEIFSLIQTYLSCDFTSQDPLICDWQKTMRSKSCMVAPFPIPIYGFDSSSVEAFSKIEKIIYTARNIRGEMNLGPKEKISCYLIGSQDNLQVAEENKHLLYALLPLEDLIFTNQEPDAFGAHQMVDQIKVFIALSPEMQEKEQIRLCKEKEKLLKQKDRVTSQLNNQDFITKAPNQLVEKFQHQLHSIESELDLIEEKLKKLTPR